MSGQLVDKTQPVRAAVCIDANSHRSRVIAKRDAIVEMNLALVRSIAASVMRSLPPSFDLDDLIAVGNMALIQAATRYRPRQHDGTPFSAFARPSIRGAMIESVRRRHYAENTRPSIDDVPDVPVDNVIETEIDAGRLRRRIAVEVSWLSPAQRSIIRALYLAEDATLSLGALRCYSIARSLGITMAAAERIHAEALAELRRRGKLAA